MNGRTCKILKKFAKLRGKSFDSLKNWYQNQDQETKGRVLKKMKIYLLLNGKTF